MNVNNKSTILSPWWIKSWVGMTLGLLLCCQVVSASDSADFLRMNITAAGAAQTAGAALGEGSHSLTWNPAGILGQENPSVSLTHFESFADTAYEQLNGIYPHWLDAHWGIKLFYAKTYDFYETDNSGDEVEFVDNADRLLQLTWAKSLEPNLSLGVSAKIFSSVLAGYTRYGGALDLGIQYHLFDQLVNFGLACQNLGMMSAFDQTPETLPLVIVAGLGTKLWLVDGHELQAAVDYSLQPENSDENYAGFGMAYQAFNLLVLRAGYRMNKNTMGNLTMGLGVKLFKFGIDYAYQPVEDLGNNHRLTLSYYFEPDRSKDKAELTPAPETIEPKYEEADLASRYSSQPHLMKGEYRFMVPEVNEQVNTWTFEVRDSQGKLIRKMITNNMQPKEFVWDGKDEQGRTVPKKKNYQFIIKTDHKIYQAAKLPQVEPVLKLWFEDGLEHEPEVEWHFSEQSLIKHWVLSIIDRETREEVRQLAGKDELPDIVIWDGYTQNHKIAKTNHYYDYQLTITYPDEQVLTMNEPIETVAAKTTDAPNGEPGLLIYGILYDFNQTKLKPEMINKVLMVARILKKNQQRKAVCEGKADQVGSDTYNWNLSYRRAKNVAYFLKQSKNLQASQIEVVGYGEKMLWSKEENKQSQVLNRRVDIKLLIPKIEK